MGSGNNIRHTLTTCHYCSSCKEKFKCKKPISNKEKKKCEALFKIDNSVPKCSLCYNEHWRCSDKKCKLCCNLNKCSGIVYENSITCQNCIDNGLECKRTFPRTIEEWEYFEERGVTYICNKLEGAEGSVRLHEQPYIQFKNRITYKGIKELFKDSLMHIEYLYGNSDHC
jgi:hypothetical protein